MFDQTFFLASGKMSSKDPPAKRHCGSPSVHDLVGEMALVATISPELFQCTICGKKIKHRRNVRAHVRSLHMARPPPATSQLCLVADCMRSKLFLRFG